MAMNDFDRDEGVNRGKGLECMTWVGTGVLWTIAGGVPHSLGIMGEAQAQEVKGLTFLQISDSHVGFDKPANPIPLGPREEAVSKIIALPQKPAFMIHTGDISHLSLESQFDDADLIISQTKLDVHYVPGEHDFLDPEQKFYRERYGRGTKGAGWYSFDANGVHFIGLVNVIDLKAGGLGNLGNDQLEWLEADVKGRSASTPIVVFAHIPLWTVYPDWGWGTEDGAQALSYLKKFGSVTVLNGHIHQVMQKVEGNVTSSGSPSSTRRSRPEESKDDEICTCRGRTWRGRRFGPGWRRLGRQGGEPGDRRVDRQFHLHAANADREGRHHGDLDQQGRHPAWYRRDQQCLQAIAGARHRRQLFVHVHHARYLSILLLRSSAYDGHDRCGGRNGQQRFKLML